MPSNVLTDTKCRTAKPTAKAQKLFDGFGLFLYLAPTGSKLWRMAYRLNGKQQTATFGPYPLVSLADARLKRDEIRKKIALGEPLKVTARKSISVKDAISTYWTGRNDVTEGYRADAINGLDMHITPILGKRQMRDIDKQALMGALLVLDSAGKHVYVRRCRMWFGQVFDWAIEQGYCEVNPAEQIKPEKAFGSKPVKHHARVALKDVPALLHRLSLEKQLLSVLGCKMLALTWVRTKELRQMTWGQIEGDVWRIPSTAMKMRREHLVPLSKQALETIGLLKARSRGGAYVFPSDRRIDRAMSENSILYMLGRIGYQGLMTGHGFRGIASTWANERGYPKDHIEKQLAHDSGDKVRDAYNAAEYWPGRVKMLADFADWLDECLLSQESKVSSPSSAE
jgi:integrase